MSTSTISLKLLIDSKHNKVVVAEAGKDFVDFLLNLLSLPLGTVIQLLTKPAMTGCIANLYGSLEEVDESYLQPNHNKDSILNPTITTQITNPSFLLPDTKKPENKKLYYCRNHPGCVSDIKKSVCSQCRSEGYGTSYLSQEVVFAGTNDSTSTDTPTSDQGGYVKGLVTYMVTDDLSVSPMSMISVVGLLNKFDIKDLSVLEEKVLEFGINEALELLKASLSSKEALTAVFRLKQKVGYCEPPEFIPSFIQSQTVFADVSKTVAGLPELRKTASGLPKLRNTVKNKKRKEKKFEVISGIFLAIPILLGRLSSVC